jgi:hypothetical protein
MPATPAVQPAATAAVYLHLWMRALATTDAIHLLN